MEQGEARRPEGSSEIEGYLGDPATTPDRRPYARAGALQFSHRQQLRSCDLVRLRVRDVCCNRSVVASRTIVMQQKSQLLVQFELTEQTRDSLDTWIRSSDIGSEDYLFPSRLHASPHLSTRQYARIVGGWIREIGLDASAYGTHTLRRTKASLIYRRTKNLRVVQLLLGHIKLESTVRYLRIEVDDALERSEQTSRTPGKILVRRVWITD
jgi:integrase